jgi:hypothetical protein
MNVHHSTIQTYLKIADFNLLYFCVTNNGAFFGQSTFSKLGNFGGAFSKLGNLFQSW